MNCKFCNQEHEVEELCKISRRSFFFFSTAALITLSTAKLSLPSPKKILTESEIIITELEAIMPPINSLFDKDDIFYRTIKSQQIIQISSKQIRVPLRLT